jgi:hypothetical protein
MDACLVIVSKMPDTATFERHNGYPPSFIRLDATAKTLASRIGFVP